MKAGTNLTIWQNHLSAVITKDWTAQLTTQAAVNSNAFHYATMNEIIKLAES